MKCFCTRHYLCPEHRDERVAGWRGENQIGLPIKSAKMVGPVMVLELTQYLEVNALLNSVPEGGE